MSQIVLTFPATELVKMKNYYHNELVDKMPQGAMFVAKTGTCTITAYNSGKVLFQGKDCNKEAGKWATTEMIGETRGTRKKHPSDHLPKNFSSLSVIGSDEVGTGDYFGPITVVAAYVEKEKIPLLKKLGVQDSKNLTDEKICSIAKQIKEVLPFSLLTVNNEKYNTLQRSGMNQGKMKALLHNQAIGHVLKKIAPKKPDAILIDEFVKKETYFQYLSDQKNIYKENVFFSQKGESVHVAVAAASILARYAFIQHMDQLSLQAGFPIPKGAGPVVDEACAKLIKEKGPEILNQYVKLHFANTEKALQIAKRNK